MPRNRAGYDAVLAMYHDQGLPVLKHAGFGAAVNVTLGLPIIRTSVDHGTALDLAGTGRAEAGSLRGRHRAGRAGSRERALLMRARKRFGQHFLHDPAVIERIVGSDRAAPGRGAGRDRPGPGRADARRCSPPSARSTSIEIDRDLAAALRARFRRTARPAACTRPTRWSSTSRALARARGARLRLVGNLPYNISTPLLFHLLDAARARSRDMHFMLQKEVVDRIVAAARQRAHYGRLGVMLAPLRAGDASCSMSARAPSGRRRRSGRPWCG